MTLLSLAGCVNAIAEWIFAKESRNKFLRQACETAVAVAVFAAASAGLYAYDGTGLPRNAASLAVAVGTPFVGSVDAPDVVRIDIRRQPSWKDADLLAYTGRHFRNAGEWFAVTFNDRLGKRDVTLRLVTPIKDKFGAVSDEDLITLRWARDDIGRIKWRSLNSDELVSLAQTENITPAGKRVLSAWCEKHNGIGAFCGRF